MLNRVYQLQQVMDDPRFEGFASTRDKGFRRDSISVDFDFLPNLKEGRGWKAPRLSNVWRPLKVEGRVREMNDFPCLDLTVPAFSPRAVKALRSYLEANGELLPLVSKLGTYYAYNVTTVADVIPKCKMSWAGKQRTFPEDIRTYAFIARALKGLSIFRIPEMPVEVYVTESFANRVREAELKGFDLQEVWSEGNFDEAKSGKGGSRRGTAGATSQGQALTANTVVLRLGLADPNRRANKEERAHVAILMEELDALLVKPKSDVLVGNLEGHDYSAKGECRLFLSCPDADALVRKLKRWLARLDWKGDVVLVKRYGQLRDVDAREASVRF